MQLCMTRIGRDYGSRCNGLRVKRDELTVFVQSFGQGICDAQLNKKNILVLDRTIAVLWMKHQQ